MDSRKTNTNQNILNYVIGGIFTLTAIIQLIKILMHKDAAEKLDHLEARPTISGELKAEQNKAI